jgi:hypothetical protein
MAEYPEHEKLTKVKDQSQLIGAFLDWLEQSGYTICEYSKKREEFFPIHQSVQKWLAEYFDIDLEKLDAEKVSMLDKLRKAQKGGK